MAFTLLDGGTGQTLHRRLGEPATPLWSAEALKRRPDAVTTVHADFLRAGAEVITLASYTATPLRLAEAGREDEFDALQAAALDAAQCARDEAAPHARIAGCLPPLHASYRPEDMPSEDEAAAEYARIVAAQERGVDLFLCETLSTISGAAHATAAAKASGKPVWTALTVHELNPGRLRGGEPLMEAASAAHENGADAVLINCCRPEHVTEAVNALLAAGYETGGYANGFTTALPLAQRGATVDALERRADLGPEAYAEIALGWAEAGARIIGGCCEIEPAHIAEIARRRDALVRLRA